MKSTTKNQYGPARRIDEFFIKMSSLLNGVQDELKTNDGDHNLEDLNLGYILPEGTYLGRFRVSHPVGRGGMGVVYLGKDLRDQSAVAIKVLLGYQGKRSARSRFLREIECCEELEHQNIIRVIDYGEQDGILYCVFPFVDGFSLEKLIGHSDLTVASPKKDEQLAVSLFSVHSSSNIDPLSDGKSSQNDVGSNEQFGVKPINGRLDNKFSTQVEDASEELRTTESGVQKDRSFWKWIASIGIQAANGLYYAHQNGIIHRDIKPSNLLVDSSGTHLFIADFGLAKAVDQDQMTATGDLLGTLQYMAPEVITEHAGHQSDIYGLGISLYELVSCQHPFKSKDRSQLIQELLNQNPRRLSEVIPGIPKDLESIIHRAIEKNLEDRYETAKELAKDLQCFLDKKPISNQRKNYVKKIRRFTKQNSRLTRIIFGVAVAFALLATSTGLSVYGLIAASNARAMAEEQAGREMAYRKKIYREATTHRIDLGLMDVQSSRQSNNINDVWEKNFRKLQEIEGWVHHVEKRKEWARSIPSLALATILKPNIESVTQWDHPEEHAMDGTYAVFNETQDLYFGPLKSRFVGEKVPYGLFRVKDEVSKLIKEINLPGEVLLDFDNYKMEPTGKWALVRNSIGKSHRKNYQRGKTQLIKVDLSSGAHRLLPIDGDISCYDYCAATNQLVVVSGNEMTFWNMATFKKIPELCGILKKKFSVIRFSCDGSRLVGATGPHVKGYTVERNFLDTGDADFSIRVYGRVQKFAWRSDDRLLAIGYRGRIAIFDTEKIEFSRYFSVSHREFRTIDFCADGMTMISTGLERGTVVSNPEAETKITRLPECLCDCSKTCSSCILVQKNRFYRKKIQPSACSVCVRSPSERPIRRFIRLPESPLFWVNDGNRLLLFDLKKHLIVDKYYGISVSDCVLNQSNDTLFFVAGTKVYRQQISKSERGFRLRKPKLLIDLEKRAIDRLAIDKQNRLEIWGQKTELDISAEPKYSRLILARNFKSIAGWKIESDQEMSESKWLRHLQGFRNDQRNPVDIAEGQNVIRASIGKDGNNIPFTCGENGYVPLKLYLAHEDPIDWIACYSENRWLVVVLENFKLVLVDLYEARMILEEREISWPKEMEKVGMPTEIFDYILEETDLPPKEIPEVPSPDAVEIQAIG